MVLLAEPITHGTNDSKGTECFESNTSFWLEPLYASNKAEIALLDQIIDIN